MRRRSPIKPGAGKRKGGAFERVVCAALSKWITKGARSDVLWRASMSGGRATIHLRKGVLNPQSGDIAAIHEDGHAFTKRFFIECKHIRNLKVSQFLIFDQGPLARFWSIACQQAKQHNKEPLLIARQNHYPTLIVMQSCPTRTPKHMAIATCGALVARFEDVFKKEWK